MKRSPLPLRLSLRVTNRLHDGRLKRFWLYTWNVSLKNSFCAPSPHAPPNPQLYVLSASLGRQMFACNIWSALFGAHNRALQATRLCECLKVHCCVKYSLFYLQCMRGCKNRAEVIQFSPQEVLMQRYLSGEQFECCHHLHKCLPRTMGDS